MKPSLYLLALIILFVFSDSSVATKSPAEGRRVTDLNLIPTRVLQRSISPKFYRSLLVSPVEGWIVVRGQLCSTRLSGIRIVRSELDGAYDALALKLASEVVIAGDYTIEKPKLGSSVLMHLLIYRIADGTMALSFPHLDEPGGDQAEYFGCARLAVQKTGGPWTEIKGPEGLEGKGWAVRRGVKTNLKDALKMELKIPGH